MFLFFFTFHFPAHSQIRTIAPPHNPCTPHNSNCTALLSNELSNRTALLSHELSNTAVTQTVAPVVESFTFPKNLTRGKRLRAVCTVTEGDLPIDIEWRKDGVTLLPDATLSGPKVRRIDEYTSMLAISSLDTVHAGNYSCLASNAVAEVAKSAILTIRGKM